MNFAAVPYLQAMTSMEGDEGYGADSSASVVAYFLSNSTSSAARRRRR